MRHNPVAPTSVSADPDSLTKICPGSGSRVLSKQAASDAIIYGFFQHPDTSLHNRFASVICARRGANGQTPETGDPYCFHRTGAPRETRMGPGSRETSRLHSRAWTKCFLAGSSRVCVTNGGCDFQSEVRFLWRWSVQESLWWFWGWGGLWGTGCGTRISSSFVSAVRQEFLAADYNLWKWQMSRSKG